MSLKANKDGFLVGELDESNQDATEELNASLTTGQNTGNRLLGGIRTDVSAIAKALNVAGRSSSPHPVVEPAGRRGASEARGGSPGQPSMSAQHTGGFGAASTHATVSPAGRDSKGRFSAVAGGAQAGADGSRLLDKLGVATDALKGLASGSGQMDPSLAALKEVKDVVAPIGRGAFALLGRSGTQKKERWYQKIWKTLTNIEKKPAGGSPGGMPSMDSGDSSLMGGIAGIAARFIPAIIPIALTAIGAALAVGIGAFAGTAIGTAIYEWLTKSGLMEKIFDAIDAAKDKVKQVKNDFNKGQDEVLNPVKYAPPVLDDSGRNRNDPRRLDRPDAVTPDGRMINDPRRLDAGTGELPPSTSVAQSLGRGKGHVVNFLKDKAGFVPLTDENDPTKNMPAKARAKKTGDAYTAGNIGGLNDAQTRALVASTALTESSGGKLGVVNQAGYVGRYQAGAGWLADAGLIKGGAVAVSAAMATDGFKNEYKWGQSGGMSKFLKNDSNWNDGMNYRGYLTSPTVQDAAFKKNSDSAYAQLMTLGPTRGGIDASTPPEQVAGLLKARHLSGIGGARQVVLGGAGPSDSNGTSARKYYNDLATDKNGFLAAYSAPSIPSSVPTKLPAMPEIQVLAPSTEKDRPVSVTIRQPIGQNLSDRGIAHVVTGGIGATGSW
ncbi:MAG: hypothetical protein HHJ17_08650 [Rhodoferax sp.]|uniref:hypothetical protein n=1 Tax=Rhodoferax sp. TaxID=50421 RepID=UPI0018534CF6|nr:hypothetical protein [Rhodoferax sp.]NMM13590.1 hypothetical protein [Rhodoferax sp.]